jgi:hypothetical protein
MQPEFGTMVAEPQQLAPAILALLADDAQCSRMGVAARAYAERHPFSSQAAELARILLQ